MVVAPLRARRMMSVCFARNDRFLKRFCRKNSRWWVMVASSVLGVSGAPKVNRWGFMG